MNKTIKTQIITHLTQSLLRLIDMNGNLCMKLNKFTVDFSCKFALQ